MTPFQRLEHAYRILCRVERDPVMAERFDMNAFMQGIVKPCGNPYSIEGMTQLLDAGQPMCGTAACMMGWLGLDPALRADGLVVFVPSKYGTGYKVTDYDNQWPEFFGVDPASLYGIIYDTELPLASVIDAVGMLLLEHSGKPADWQLPPRERLPAETEGGADAL